MAILYRTTDKVKIKIHDIEVAIRPLSFHEKSEISALISGGTPTTAALEAVKTCLLDIKGVQLPDGSEFELQFHNDKLTEACLDDLMNMEHNKELVLVCLSILSGIPKDFIDDETGEVLQGVSIVKENKPRKKK